MCGTREGKEMKRMICKQRKKGNMFFARYEPFLSKYLLYYKTDLYYFSYEEIKNFLNKGKVVVNAEHPKDCMSAPLGVQIAITGRCNFNCHNCYDTDVNQKNKQLFSIEQKKGFIDYLYNWGVLFIQWSGGEPLLASDLKEIVEYTGKKGFMQSILTNGSQLVNEELAIWVAKNVERVQVSFNAVDRFEEWTGVRNFQALLKGMMNVSKWCANHKTTFNIVTTVDKISVGELEKIAFWVNKIKPTNWRIGEEVPLGKAEKQTRHHERLEESYRIFLKLKKQYNKNNWNHCFEVEEGDSLFPIEWQSSPAGKTFLYISVTGEAYPFPYFKTPEFYLGKYPEDDLRDVWFNSPVLKKLRAVKYDDTSCKGCKNICVKWAREITYHFSHNLKETPVLFTNCPRKKD